MPCKKKVGVLFLHILSSSVEILIFSFDLWALYSWCNLKTLVPY
uniref:Uncharacterized protein n=1 Tax=Arundo donax TaxID=35708 RepID=A0A0A9A482_ARUDO